MDSVPRDGGSSRLICEFNVEVERVSECCLHKHTHVAKLFTIHRTVLMVLADAAENEPTARINSSKWNKGTDLGSISTLEQNRSVSVAVSFCLAE